MQQSLSSAIPVLALTFSKMLKIKRIVLGQHLMDIKHVKNGPNTGINSGGRRIKKNTKKLKSKNYATKICYLLVVAVGGGRGMFEGFSMSAATCGTAPLKSNFLIFKLFLANITSF